MSGLHYACRNGLYDEVVKLINHGHNPNLADQKGNTPLCLAIKRSDRIAKYLLDNNTDPNSADHQGNSALILAVVHDRTELVKLLIERGAHLTYNGKVALYYTVKNKNLKIAERLLQLGASPNDYNNNGETSLHIAIKNGSYFIAKLLLAYNADPYLLTNYGGNRKNYSSFDFAKRINLPGCLNLLEKFTSLDIKEPETN